MAVYASSSSRLVKNTISNFLAQAIPLVVGIASLPYTIRGLGPEGFGILSLAWVLVGYFGLFDLGLGRATTKFVAEAMGRGEDERIPKIVWASLATQAILGVIGGALLVTASPFLASRILKVPVNWVGEVRSVLFLLGGSIPIVVCSRNVRGILEAAQRFDLVNAIRIPLGALTFVVPMVGALLHLRVSLIVLLLILLILASALAYLVCSCRVFPGLMPIPSIDRTLIRPLLVFGGWVTVSNTLIPTLGYLDRLLIGALVSVSALTYYTTPHEVASRLLVFPAALSTTLFPAFSALSVRNREDLKRLYVRSLKYVVLGLGPVALIGAVFANDILRIWIGRDFAARSYSVLTILSVGMLPSALALMPSNLLDSIGRPDVRAKVFLSYAFVYVALLWVLISDFGIVGAAMGWALRGCVECVLFFAVSARLLRIGMPIIVESGLWRAITAYGGLVLLILLPVLLVTPPVFRWGIVLFGLGLFGFVAWRYVLDERERGGLMRAVLTMERRKTAERIGV